MSTPPNRYDAGARLPAPRGDVGLAVAGDRVVVAVPGRGGAHVLDASACALLDLLDDRPTAGELVTRVASLSGRDPSTLREDVARAVAELDAAGLLSADGAEVPSTATGPVGIDEEPAAWPQPRTACQNSFDSWRKWQPSEVVRAGRHLLGLRTDDEVLRGRLAHLAGAAGAPRSAGVPAHLSLETTGPEPLLAAARPLSRLSWGCETVATAERWQDLVPVMAAWVRAVAEVDGDVLALVGSAVVVHGQALVLPPGWSGVSAQRRLSRIGHVLPGPALRLGLDDLRVRCGTDRFRVAAWLTTGLTDPATVVAEAYSRAVPPPVDSSTALTALTRLLSCVPIVAFDPGTDPRSWCGENVIVDA